MKILVTGGAGYIGSHMGATLGERGFEVLVYDNLSTGYQDSLLCGSLIVGDLANTSLLRKTLEEFKPNAVGFVDCEGASLCISQIFQRRWSGSQGTTHFGNAPHFPGPENGKRRA